MPNWWEQIKSIFSSTEKSSSSQPAIHEIIHRTPEFMEQYLQWKDSLVHKRLLNWVSEQYAIYTVDKDKQDSSIDFLKTPSTKGLAIHFVDMNYNNKEATFLFDYFKEKIKENNYRTQVSDTRTFSKNSWIETVARHHLKPRPNYDEDGKINQAFGNITILLTSRNEQVYNLKLSATAYQDRLFNEEKRFSELLRLITF